MTFKSVFKDTGERGQTIQVGGSDCTGVGLCNKIRTRHTYVIVCILHMCVHTQTHTIASSSSFPSYWRMLSTLKGTTWAHTCMMLLFSMSFALVPTLHVSWCIIHDSWWRFMKVWGGVRETDEGEGSGEVEGESQKVLQIMSTWYIHTLVEGCGCGDTCIRQSVRSAFTLTVGIMMCHNSLNTPTS